VGVTKRAQSADAIDVRPKQTVSPLEFCASLGYQVQFHGITDRNRLDERVPTVLFTWGDRHPREIAAALGEQGMSVWTRLGGWAMCFG
jgi:selenocysteine lyase/cysteine desulfurase